MGGWVTDFDALEEHVFARLEAIGLSPAQMQLFRPISEIADKPIKFVLRDSRGRSLGVLHWSPPAAVQTVANSVRLAEAARRRLGDELGSVVLAASLEGGQILDRSRHNKCTYKVEPST